MSNLQWQVFFIELDLGYIKVEVVVNYLCRLNLQIEISVIVVFFFRENVCELVCQADLVIDGIDNFFICYLSNDVCVLEGKFLVYGGIYWFEGQVLVFNLLWEDGSCGFNYWDIFFIFFLFELVFNCVEGGVLGVLFGIIGSMQANEVIKVLVQVGELLDGKFYFFDVVMFLF